MQEVGGSIPPGSTIYSVETVVFPGLIKIPVKRKLCLVTIWRPSQGHPGDGSGNANTNGWTSSGSGGAMPIIVDLAGMGIKIEELSRSNIFIDSEGSGLKHRTAWVGVVDHTQSITTGMDSNGVRTQMR